MHFLHCSSHADIVFFCFHTHSFTPLATVGGLNLALLVALKQHIPEHEVGFAAAKMRMNYAPLAFIAALLVLTLLGQFNPAGLFFSLICFHSSWMYLRYFKTNGLNGVRGDASEAFAFATLFPDPVRPFVAVAGTVLHLFCKPVINLLLSSGGEAPTANGTAKPDLVSSIAQERTTSLDSERRRQRAMKALDERLAGSQSDSAV